MKTLNGMLRALTWLLILPLTGSLGRLAAEPDWEAVLEESIQSSARRSHLTERRASESQWEAFMRQFPDSEETAVLQKKRLTDLFNDQKWDAYLPTAQEWLLRTDSRPDLQSSVLFELARLAAIVKDAPPAVRDAAFALVTPRLQRRAGLVGFLRNYVAQRGSPEANYATFQRMVETCGPTPSLGRLVWTFVPPLAQGEDKAAAIKACQDFLETYGGDHPEGRAARKLLLELEGQTEGLAALKKESDEARKASRSALQALENAVKEGDFAASQEALRSFLETVPRFERVAAWPEFLKALDAADASVRLALLEQTLDDIPPGDARESVRRGLVEGYRLDPDKAEVVLKALALMVEANDRGWVAANWDFALRGVPAFKEAGPMRTRAYHAAAEAMRELGLEALEVEYLYESCRQGWSLDREKAIESLRAIAPLHKKYPAAAKAGWLLAVIEGRQPLSFSGAQRPWHPPARDDTGFPLVVASPRNQPPTEARTHFDTQKNLLDLSGARTLTGEPAALGQEPWRPKELPATLKIPLKRPATVGRMRVEFEEPVHFVVSLLDDQGRVLARHERAWELWEYLPSSHLWPEAAVDLEIPPVDGVAALRLEIYSAEGIVGLRKIEAQATEFPLREWVAGPVVPLPSDARSLLVPREVREPEIKRDYFMDTEEIRGFPITRWEAPWKKFGKQPANLHMLGDHLAFHFRGETVAVEVSRAGALSWKLNDLQGEIRHDNPDVKAVTEYPVAKDLPAGLQVLRLGSRPLSVRQDEYTPKDAHIHRFRVTGHARAAIGLRFSADGKSWSEWFGPVAERVGIPETVGGKRPRFAQAGIHFDSGAARGSATAEVNKLELTPALEPGAVATPWEDTPPPRPVENLAEAARLLAARRVTVVFPQVGPGSEHDAARKLAAHARVPLVSDDLGLNRYPALPLVVGTPLLNRYTRQLIATRALWQDADYLNNPEGLVFVVSDDETGEPEAVYVTGENSEAVARAAERLRKAVPAAPAPAAPFRVFASNPLERVYAWSLHPERPAPATLELQLGRGDKRSLQIGVAAEKQLDDFQIEWGDFSGPNQKRLPQSALQVRTAAFYEWIPFFGSLRLPNALTESPPLPIPQDSAFGLWVTVTTPEDLPAGEYHGEISLKAGGQTTRLPMTVHVEDFVMPRISTIPTYSFAQVPYWFSKGTPVWEAAVTALAENEARQGVSHLSAPNEFSAIKSPSMTPTAWRTGNDTAWRPASDKIAIPEGAPLELRFAKPTPARLLAVGVVKAPATDSWTLEQSTDGGSSWSPLGTAALSDKENSVLIFPLEGKPLETLRLRPEKGGSAEVATVRAFSEDRPFRADFSLLGRQLDLMDAAYKRRGLPLPTYILQDPPSLGLLSQALFGVSSGGWRSIAGFYARELVAFLKETGREKRLLFKVGDEPADIAVWAESAKPFHEEGLRTMTCHGDRYPNIAIATGLMNPWVPNYQHNINLPFFQERKKAGDPLWWYICGVPVTRLTGSPIENLPFYWLTAKWGLDGAMNYAAMHASDFVMPVPFRYEHGMDHRILFLPDGSVLDTTRRELEGDGIRDMELLFAIQRQIGTMTDSAKAEDARSRLKTLLEKMVPYKYGYPEDPQTWLDARSALYSMIQETGKKFPKKD